MGVSIKLDMQAIAGIKKAALAAALETMELLHTDLVSSATMPFDTGNMQNGGTYVSKSLTSKKKSLTIKGNEIVDFSTGSEIHLALTNDAPQARRLYYHPQYNFQKGKNANAGAYWLEPYITGSKKDFVAVNFAEALKRRI